MKSPIGKHGNITQTVPNDTSARARRARSSYKFKNVTSPCTEIITLVAAGDYM